MFETVRHFYKALFYLKSEPDESLCFCELNQKVAGTSSSCEEKRGNHTPMESENSSNSSGVDNNISNPQSLSPSTTQVPTSSSKRRRPRKGIPYRSPLQWDQIAEEDEEAAGVTFPGLLNI